MGYWKKLLKQWLAQTSIENIGTIITVDDDNPPLLENIPPPNYIANQQCVMAANWGFQGTCQQRMNNIPDGAQTIKNQPNNHLNLVDMFDLFFPSSTY